MIIITAIMSFSLAKTLEKVNQNETNTNYWIIGYWQFFNSANEYLIEERKAF